MTSDFARHCAGHAVHGNRHQKPQAESLGILLEWFHQCGSYRSAQAAGNGLHTSRDPNRGSLNGLGDSGSYIGSEPLRGQQRRDDAGSGRIRESLGRIGESLGRMARRLRDTGGNSRHGRLRGFYRCIADTLGSPADSPSGIRRRSGNGRGPSLEPHCCPRRGRFLRFEFLFRRCVRALIDRFGRAGERSPSNKMGFGESVATHRRLHRVRNNKKGTMILSMSATSRYERRLNPISKKATNKSTIYTTNTQQTGAQTVCKAFTFRIICSDVYICCARAGPFYRVTWLAATTTNRKILQK
jgi:hypothetical protein